MATKTKKSKSAIIEEEILANPGVSTGELAEKLSKPGFEIRPNLVSAVKSAMREKGKLPRPRKGGHKKPPHRELHQSNSRPGLQPPTSGKAARELIEAVIREVDIRDGRPARTEFDDALVANIELRMAGWLRRTLRLTDSDMETLTYRALQG